MDDEGCFFLDDRRARAVHGLDILTLLPPELSLQILTLLPLPALLSASLVSRGWNLLARDPWVWCDVFHREWGVDFVNARARGWDERRSEAYLFKSELATPAFMTANDVGTTGIDIGDATPEEAAARLNHALREWRRRTTSSTSEVERRLTRHSSGGRLSGASEELGLALGRRGGRFS